MTVAALQGVAPNQIPRVLFTRSNDHGKTWTKPTAVNDTPDGRSAFQPTIAASSDGQHVTIAFYDKRNSAGHGYLVLQQARFFDVKIKKLEMAMNIG